MSIKSLLIFGATLLITTQSWAQKAYIVDSKFNSIRQNSVSSMEGIGDTLWISPILNRNIGNAYDWYLPENADSLVNGRGSVFSIDLAPDTVVAGLGFTSETPDGNFPAAMGYYFSIDGGDTWRFSEFLLDARPETGCSSSNSCDTTFVYGGETYTRTRITVKEQSPPYDVAFRSNVVFSANWASGLLRSTDFGNSWERVVLPPENASSLNPTQQDYFWFTCNSTQNGRCVESENKYNPIFDDNLKAFGLHIDDQQRVWLGTAAGINISDNALTAPTDSIEWRHIVFNGADDGLLGSWIIEIEQEPGTNRVWMTNWLVNSAAGEQFGIVSTDNGGQSFNQYLKGIKINSIEFKDGAIIAAGDNGLYISENGGTSWTKLPSIKSANAFIREGARYLSLATTSDRLWVGTNDGIASTNDLGVTWEVHRVNFPLEGGNIHEPNAKSVNTYAYPNPFSPSQSGLTRIRYEVDKNSTVRIRVFDFGMNLISELTNQDYTPGDYETTWDGKDRFGRRVANGTYIYIIEFDGQTVHGKISVIE